VQSPTLTLLLLQQIKALINAERNAKTNSPLVKINAIRSSHPHNDSGVKFKTKKRLLNAIRAVTDTNTMADTPYVLDLPVVVGNINQTLANLVALRLDVLSNPKPEYDVHGHHYKWVDFYKFLGEEINNLIKQSSKLQPFEIISMAR
jgi:hypothetical protein